MERQATALGPEQVAKWFLMVGVFNALVSIGFLAPFILPGPTGTSDLFVLAFAVASFPGTWMLFAFAMFLIVGVLGMIGWSAVYYLQSALYQKRSSNKMLSMAHLAITVIGVYGSAIFLFMAGFIGGRAGLDPSQCSVLQEGCMGAGVAIINALISWTVIPTAGSIGLAALGTLIGIINVLMIFRSKS